MPRHLRFQHQPSICRRGFERPILQTEFLGQTPVFGDDMTQELTPLRPQMSDGQTTLSLLISACQEVCDRRLAPTKKPLFGFAESQHNAT